MRRTGRPVYAGGVGVALVGVLVVAAALSLYGTGGSPDDTVGCPSLAATDVLPQALQNSCAAWRAHRATFGHELTVAGSAIVALGVLLGVLGGRAESPSRPVGWSTLGWSVLPPVAFVLLAFITAPDGQSNDGVMTALGQVFVAGGVFLAWCGASARRYPAARAHLLVAAAVSVPVICAGTAVLTAVGSQTVSRPWRLQEAAFPFGGGSVWVPVLLSGGVCAGLFAVAVGLARRGRPAVNLWAAGALFTVSTAVVVTVFVPDLVPSWRNVDAFGWDGPAPSVWLPVLVAPALLVAVVWAAVARTRAVPAAPPSATPSRR